MMMEAKMAMMLIVTNSSMRVKGLEDLAILKGGSLMEKIAP